MASHPVPTHTCCLKNRKKKHKKVLLGVCPLVSGKKRLKSKGTPTLGTQVRLLPCMAPLMPNEVELLAKSLATLRAHIGLLPRVCLLVSDEERLKLKSSTTL